MAKSKANGAVADSADITISPVLVLDSDVTIEESKAHGAEATSW